MKRILSMIALAGTLLSVSLLFATPGQAACGKECKQAKNFCKSYKKNNPGVECGTVRGAICTGKSWKKIKQVNWAWSACKLVKGQDDIAKAKARCAEFKKNWGGKCEVSSPLCRAGWVKLGKYGKFRACRPIQITANMRYNIYKAFMRKFEGKAKHKMHPELRKVVAKHYKMDPNKVRWGYASNTPSTCITDCMNIYCNNKNLIDQVRTGRVSASIIFHELEHSAQCVKRGSRKEYAKLWFKDLPIGFFGAFDLSVKDKFKNKIHDKMPMEKQAEAKAQSVAKSGWWTKTAKCRVYKSDKKTIVYASSGVYYRYYCDPAFGQDGSKKLKSEATKAASKSGYGKYYFALGMPHTGNGVWLGSGKFGLDPKIVRKGIKSLKK